MTLLRDRDVVVLRVQDNGMSVKRESRPWTGTEFRMMRYRAEMIGAQLNIAAMQPHGAIVTCKLQLKEKTYG